MAGQPSLRNEPIRALVVLISLAVLQHCLTELINSPLFGLICFSYIALCLFGWEASQPRNTSPPAAVNKARVSSPKGGRKCGKALVPFSHSNTDITVLIYTLRPNFQRHCFSRSYTSSQPSRPASLGRSRTETQPPHIQHCCAPRSHFSELCWKRKTLYLEESQKLSVLYNLLRFVEKRSAWVSSQRRTQHPRHLLLTWYELKATVSPTDFQHSALTRASAQHPRQLLLTWHKPKATVSPVPHTDAERIFLTCNILKWAVFEGGHSFPQVQQPSVDITDYIVDVPGISVDHNFYHLCITHVEPVWPHQEDENGDYKPPSRLLAARGKTLSRTLKIPAKARHSIYGFKRVPDRLFPEPAWCEVQGALFLNKKTCADLVTRLVMKQALRVLDMEDFELPARLDTTAFCSMIKAKLGSHTSAEWEYITDEYLDMAQLHTVFKRWFSAPDLVTRFDGDRAKLGDYPSPMFVDALIRAQELFWYDHHRLPDPTTQEVRDIIRGVEMITWHYILKFSATLENRKGGKKMVPMEGKDDITLWMRKHRNFHADYEFFEADEDCEDPEAHESSVAEDEEDEEDDFRQAHIISRYFDSLPQPPPKDVKLSEHHQEMKQSTVNHIFAWINLTAVEDEALITGIHKDYVSATGELVLNNTVECFQQLVAYRCRHEISPQLSTYLPVTKELDSKLESRLRGPLLWKQVMRLRPEDPEIIERTDERYENLCRWAMYSPRAAILWSNSELRIPHVPQHVWSEKDIVFYTTTDLEVEVRKNTAGQTSVHNDSGYSSSSQPGSGHSRSSSDEL